MTGGFPGAAMPADSASLVLNPLTLQIAGPTGRVDVSDAESVLLQAFIATPGCRLSTTSMLQFTGRQATPEAKRALEVMVVRLRKKLIAVGSAEPTIKCIRGSGYQLCICMTLESNPGRGFRTAHGVGIPSHG